MGLCFSKKDVVLSPEKQPPATAVVETLPVEKKQVFVITHNKSNASAASGEKENRGGTPTKKASREVAFEAVNVPVATAPALTDNIRASSCTKEEVEAILIQCGRLSRSSSGKMAVGSESGIGYRKYSGSKRSFDFDNEGRDQKEWGEMKTVSRPSPCRRTPGRERSGSRERGSGGGRRLSRSPGRRSEFAPALSAVSERSKQPTKMVAVPPSSRDNGRGASSVRVNRRGNSGSGGGEMVAVRTASPRSRSPATNARILNENACPQQPPCLSRSSSRKADQSPFRRNPMAELDENCPRTNQNAGGNFNKMQKTREGEEGIQNKPIHFRSQKFSENEGQRNRGDKTELTTTAAPKNNNNLIAHSVPESQPPIESTAADAPTDRASSSKLESQMPRTITRSRSSRRSSRDLDQALGLLEDIQAYNQQHPEMAVSLPACISKACSILEAVADLNSTTTTTSEPRSCYLPLKPVPVALESVEPQESAGSNSFVSHDCPEPNSVDSISKSSSDQLSQCQPPPATSRSVGGRVAPATPNEKRREFYRRNQQIHRGNGRACSTAAPVAVSL
ncbi:serine/arginine repetitive matrix protein 2-like [Zingiber officinale]|uniref:Uncharacterized protein n=1 Tax=Zingiber officinale TaxID=94328 RepID=A0A8J5G1D7_ZINOF|nr:serine/arginine repetitive matrix protein 2-like [Zingiber officinale]KAG6496139.1 hypothetical protein ZIOFF_043987 [Zingiber officinale]